MSLLSQCRGAEGNSPVDSECGNDSGPSWPAMEHRQRQGSQAEDGGLRTGVGHSHYDPSDVLGDGGELWGSPSLGFQKRWPVGHPDLEAILWTVPRGCQKFSQGLSADVLVLHVFLFAIVQSSSIWIVTHVLCCVGSALQFIGFWMEH